MIEPVPRYYAVTGKDLLVHVKVAAAVLDEEIKFIKRVDVEQSGDTVPGGELAERHLFLGCPACPSVYKAFFPS